VLGFCLLHLGLVVKKPGEQRLLTWAHRYAQTCERTERDTPAEREKDREGGPHRPDSCMLPLPLPRVMTVPNTCKPWNLTVDSAAESRCKLLPSIHHHHHDPQDYDTHPSGASCPLHVCSSSLTEKATACTPAHKPSPEKQTNRTKRRMTSLEGERWRDRGAGYAVRSSSRCVYLVVHTVSGMTYAGAHHDLQREREREERDSHVTQLQHNRETGRVHHHHHQLPSIIIGGASSSSHLHACFPLKSRLSLSNRDLLMPMPMSV
jgi:hypothetical protein